MTTSGPEEAPRPAEDAEQRQVQEVGDAGAAPRLVEAAFFDAWKQRSTFASPTFFHS